ncbi:MAG TPA: class I SAM-dependent methyltransferase [Kofleriaceae bacterium]|nr:class I SAM-dependent methyltransferase [Kofleriaceae bacterium]
MSADDFMRAFHARKPGVTARAFARGTLAGGLGEGRSSYSLLADAARVGERVLDLGCGDGWLLQELRARGSRAEALVGIDMSREELAAARAREALAGVDLRCERAQALSLEAGSIDVALSHLAFMLMTDIESVVAELARVVRPGGRFATVVGGGPEDGAMDAFEMFLDLFRDAYELVPLAARAPRLSDRRARDLAGMRELFHDGTGWCAVDEQAMALRLDGTVEAVWHSLVSMYEMAAVPAEAMERLRARFVTVAAGSLARADGTVPCVMRLRMLTCVRAG